MEVAGCGKMIILSRSDYARKPKQVIFGNVEEGNRIENFTYCS